MKTISFKIAEEDSDKIDAIVARAKWLFADYFKDNEDAEMEAQMDIVACHANGNPLDLDKFLKFNDMNFIHDFAGIRRHICRRTGELQDCFSPRCSK